MNNKIFVHKGLLTYQNVETGFNKAIELCGINGVQNLNLVVSHLGLIGSGFFINTYISKIAGMNISLVDAHLKKHRVFRFEKEGIGLNIVTTRNFSIQENSSTVVLVIWAYPDVVKKVLPTIIGYNNDVVLCTIDNGDDIANQLVEMQVTQF